ncbi:MAG: LPS assembly protein LptD [Aquificaceae bacterium]|nr:LPS assembly protein LptD [Aquificaceae bacterium]MCX8060029.1 LPS assembly protein LptD [Aquificaceae bacterium]MDW8097180.1 LPS assembly protein LptD [Aquificaceae bacterium]
MLSLSLLLFPLFLSFSLEIYSQSLERLPDGSFKAQGEVEVYHKSYYIKADSITYDPVNRTVYAVGNVYVKSLAGDFKVWGQEAFVDLERDRGYFLSAEGKFKQFNFTAERVEKEGELYRVEKGAVSTCPREDREMTLCFSKATISQKYIFSQDNSLRLFSVPIAYLPLVVFPVGERRSGLLQPMLGTNTYNNLIYQQPIYWVISKDKDATLTLDFRDKQAKGVAVEYRQSIDKPLDLTGSVSLYREPSPPGRWWQGRDMATFRENRYRLRANLNLRSLKLALDLVSDPYFMQDIYFTTQERTVPYLSSYLSYRKETESSFFTVEVRRFYDTTSPTNRQTLQRLPEVGLYLKKRRLFDLFYFNTSISYVNFYREEGPRAHRLMLFPEISLPKKVLGVNFLSQLRLENLLYLNTSAVTSRNKQVLGSLRYKESMAVPFFLQRGSFQSRSFLEVSYSYRPRGYQNPRFDPMDQIEEENLLRYTLHSSGYQGGRFMYSFLLEGGYSYAGKFNYLNQQVRDRLLPVRLAFSFQPTEWLKMDADGNYSPESGRLLKLVGSVSLGWATNGITLGKVVEKRYDGRIINDQQSLSASLSYRALKFKFSSVRDKRMERDLQRHVNLDYRGACWSVGVMARDTYDGTSNRYIREAFLVFNVFDLQRFTAPLRR